MVKKSNQLEWEKTGDNEYQSTIFAAERMALIVVVTYQDYDGPETLVQIIFQCLSYSGYWKDIATRGKFYGGHLPLDSLTSYCLSEAREIVNIIKDFGRHACQVLNSHEN